MSVYCEFPRSSSITTKSLALWPVAALNLVCLNTWTQQFLRFSFLHLPLVHSSILMSFGDGMCHLLSFECRMIYVMLASLMTTALFTNPSFSCHEILKEIVILMTN